MNVKTAPEGGKELSVGNPLIDAEHAEIFALGERFRGAPSAELAREIIATTRAHLLTEEAMLSLASPGECMMHTLAHDGFRRHLDHIEAVLDSDFEHARTAIDQAIFGWLKSHIEGFDSSPHLKTNASAH